MGDGTDLTTRAGRAAARGRAERLGLLDPDSTAWHLAYLLGEAVVLPPSLVKAAGAASRRQGGDGDTARALERLERAGWVCRDEPPRAPGRPPGRWRLSERGIVELPGYEILWQRGDGRPYWLRHALSRVLLTNEVDRVWTAPELVAETESWATGGLFAATAQARHALRYFTDSGWLDPVAERRSLPRWRFTQSGIAVLTWLHRNEVDGALPRPPRALSGAVRSHDLSAARIAAALLPVIGRVGRLTMGRRLDLDKGTCELTWRRRGDYCVPDLAVSVPFRHGWRLVCVEVEAFASIPNLERHLAGYAAVAATHLGDGPDGYVELVVAIVSKDRPARRAAVERTLAEVRERTGKLPWRVAMVTPSAVPALCSGPLDTIDDLLWTPRC